MKQVQHNQEIRKLSESNNHNLSRHMKLVTISISQPRVTQCFHERVHMTNDEFETFDQ